MSIPASRPFGRKSVQFNLRLGLSQTTALVVLTEISSSSFFLVMCLSEGACAEPRRQTGLLFRRPNLVCDERHEENTIVNENAHSIRRPCF